MGDDCRADAQPKRYWNGTHRTRHPDETVRDVMRHAQRVGITRVSNLTFLDRLGLPVFSAVRPNAKSRVLAFGKGVTPSAARASALMEAVELAYGENCDLPLRYASCRELRRSALVVDVDELPKLTKSNFHEDRPILWVQGTDLISHASVWLPYETVSLDFTVPLPPGAGSFVPTSNGLASGNTVAEAISHGICELVERDASSLQYAAGVSRPVTLSDLDDACAAAIERCCAACLEVFVCDLTTDIGIPTFSCELRDNAQNLVTTGRGTHLNKHVALLRAITEAAQGRITANFPQEMGAVVPSPNRVQTMGGAAPLASIGFETIPDLACDTIDADVKLELALLQKASMNSVIAVPLTMPADPFAVVRVVIPGLEGAHTVTGYQPGRRARAAAANMVMEYGRCG